MLEPVELCIAAPVGWAEELMTPDWFSKPSRGFPHRTSTEQALNLIIRTSGGTLRAANNFCIGSPI